MINIDNRLGAVWSRGMINKNIIQTIKDKEMDRRTFLKYGGLLLLSLVGVKTVFAFLSQIDNKVVTIDAPKKATHGFGASKYGA